MRLGRLLRPPYHPRRVADGRAGQGFHLRKNKEVSDAELFAIRRALKIFLERYEQVVAYTIFSGSQVAIERALLDRSGPGQAVARIIELERLLGVRGCSATTRWRLAHREIEGNEVADDYAKWEAEAPRGGVEPEHLKEANFTRIMTEAS